MAFETVGMKPEEFVGSTTRDLWPSDIADKLIELDRKVIDEDSLRITEEWINIETDDTRWRKDIKFPIKLASGNKFLCGVALRNPGDL